MSGTGEIDPARAREALDRILASQTFRRSVQLSNFLRFTVERTLEGRLDDIKEYTVGVEAYGRPESFDPRADPTVRTEARRLRSKLERYYDNEGKADPLRIEFSKGSYVPTFVAVRPIEPAETRRRRLALVLVAIALIAAGSSVWLFRPERTDATKPRVAVLPFETESEEDESVALAMTESLITQLAATDAIDVASRAATWPVSTSATTRRELAALVHADYFVDGTITKSGDAFRVAAELVRASDGTVIWTRSREFAWSDVFDAQDDLASDLTAHLLPRANPPRRRLPTTRIDAYESYVKGRFSAVRFNNTRQSGFFEDAERRLQTATRLDPELIDAWAALGELYVMRLYPPFGDRDENLVAARGFLERALEIDPDHVTALRVLASVEAQSGRPEKGIELCRRVIELDGGNGDAHEALAGIYGTLGFYEAAIIEYNQAIDRDPLFLTAFVVKARWLERLGQNDEAVSTMQRTLELAPGSPVLYLLLGDIYYRQGDLAKAEVIWRRQDSDGLATHERSMFELALALIATERGDERAGRRVLEKYRGTPYRDLTHLTEIAALLGGADYVVERVSDHPGRSYRWLIEEPKLRRLSDAPAFQELVRTLYRRWLSHLETFGPTLSAPPPPLPTPDDYFAEDQPIPETTDADSS